MDETNFCCICWFYHTVAGRSAVFSVVLWLVIVAKTSCFCAILQKRRRADDEINNRLVSGLCELLAAILITLYVYA